jgi:glycine/D-amino acid oxidase-like deaminating enzyme
MVHLVDERQDRTTHATRIVEDKTRTGLSKVGRIPGRPNWPVALGHGGNGITYAQIASDIIVGALTGHPDADADLYDFR